MRGSLGTSIEEGLIRSIAADADNKTTTPWSSTTKLSPDPRTAIGMLHDQILRRFSHAAVIGSAPRKGKPEARRLPFRISVKSVSSEAAKCPLTDSRTLSRSLNVTVPTVMGFVGFGSSV